MGWTDTRLDGNTAAGLLGEIFPFEMTSVLLVCAGCGAMEPAGAALLYANAPGLVLRCVHCEGVLLRVVRGPTQVWLEMRGCTCMQIAMPASSTASG